MLRRKKLRDLESDFFDLNLNSLLLTICKIVHIFFNLCMSQFLQSDSWDQNTIYLLKIMWGLNKIIHENNSVEYLHISSVQFSHSVASNSLHSTPGLPVHHQLPELTQTHAHWVSDAIQPSHPLSPPSPPDPNPSQHQGVFQWVNLSHKVAKVLASASVLAMNTQDWFPLGLTGWISLQSKGLSRVFSNTTVQKHQFFGTQLSSQSNSHIHTWPLEKP